MKSNFEVLTIFSGKHILYFNSVFWLLSFHNSNKIYTLTYIFGLTIFHLFTFAGITAATYQYFTSQTDYLALQFNKIMKKNNPLPLLCPF